TIARISSAPAGERFLFTQSPGPGRWSVLQILEHLNSYNNYYLPAMATALQKGRRNQVGLNRVFRPGLLGAYFTRMMQPPANGQIVKKYKAPADHTPAASLDETLTINKFIEGQNRLVDLIQQSAQTDMNKLKIPISISKWIKLKLGDTLGFLIAHQERHFIQLEEIVRQIKAQSVQAINTDSLSVKL
ncbi:MAG: DinB family protein, partial [Sphingobacteriales bacterium]